MMDEKRLPEVAFLVENLKKRKVRDKSREAPRGAHGDTGVVRQHVPAGECFLRVTRRPGQI